ncbi:hypothetical protein [Corynebacterium sp. CCM 9203]|uniref:hypothetical protein n=1 Tax=Corynebacterium sp. CCM 9203 TaxID=3057615 RepID=UPI0035231753
MPTVFTVTPVRFPDAAGHVCGITISAGILSVREQPDRRRFIPGTKLILGLLECPLQRGVSTCSDTTDDLPCLFRVSLIGWKVNRDIGSGLRQAFRERAKHVRRLVIRERSIFSERIKQH